MKTDDKNRMTQAVAGWFAPKGLHSDVLGAATPSAQNRLVMGRRKPSRRSATLVASPPWIPSRRIAVTLGDAAGVGPEIAQAALSSGRLDPRFTYELVGVVPPGTVAGEATIESARAAAHALETAVRLAKARDVAAVVTGPVSKSGLHAIGFSFPGQTEFFADSLPMFGFRD